MTAAYWEIGRRIVECEQEGADLAAYGDELMQRLSADLSNRFGRGFSRQNLQQMRSFYLFWPEIRQTVSGKFTSEILQTVSGKFTLPWSAGGAAASGRCPHAGTGDQGPLRVGVPRFEGRIF